MLRQQAKLVAWTVYISDLIVCTAAFFLSRWASNSFFAGQFPDDAPYQGERTLLLLPFILPVWSVLLCYFKLYDSYRTKPRWAESWDIFKVVFLGTLSLITSIFAFKLNLVGRLDIGIFAASSFLLLSAERFVVRWIARVARRHGYNYRNVLVVGTGKRARKIARHIEENKDWGLKLTGIIHDKNNGSSPKVGHYPVIGNLGQISEILEQHVVDEIVFVVSQTRLREIEDCFLKCQELGIQVRVAVDFLHNTNAKVYLDELQKIPLLTFSTAPHDAFMLALKRGFDIVISLLLIVLASPLALLIAFAIRVTSRGPVIFKQVRVGLNGRRFKMYKFRTMGMDADARKEELRHLNEMGGPVFKVKDDPRLTPIGKFLRRFSLDELPQVINVFRGRMSIVGPRPATPEEVVHYRPWQRRRLSMKPGLTCLWQINGRNNIQDFDRWIKLDLEYIDHWSFAHDFKILLATIPVVLLGRGAS